MTANAQTQYSPWLHWFAILTAAATFVLLGAGGLVTSHGAGMAVPDWPNSYGYNMFLFPPSKWIGGIFYEHTHRLIATGAGLMMTVLAVWLWFRDRRKWMQWVGLSAFLLVVAQGIIGGLRVVWVDAQLGIYHAVIGQLFFVLTCAIALFTSRWWIRSPLPLISLPSDGRGEQQADRFEKFRMLVLVATTLVFLQLIIGAMMRQQHAGLAIPDFPLAYGKVWPGTSASAVVHYNELRRDVTAESPITAFQVILQMVHRIVALAIFVLVAVCTGQSQRWFGGRSPLTKLSIYWLALIIGQIALGAATIWSGKAADVATAHMLVGALSLTLGALWYVILFRRSATVPALAPAGMVSGTFGSSPVMAANK